MKSVWLLLLPSLLLAQNTSFRLSTSTIVAGAAAGGASVQLVASSSTAPWTAVSNAPWLQLTPASASGAGSASIQFSYGANPNTGAQIGTLTGEQVLAQATASAAFYATLTADQQSKFETLGPLGGPGGFNGPGGFGGPGGPGPHDLGGSH